MRRRNAGRAWLVVAAIALPSLAPALPVQLKDANGTRYNVNTQVDPLLAASLASGALTDATYTAPVTFTNFFFYFTFFGDTTTATTRYQVNVPLTPTFTGFNALFVTSLDGVDLPSPLVFNTGEPLVGGDCPTKGTVQQLLFPTQTFPALDLAVTRKVFVARHKQYARWLNVVTNTGSVPHQVGVTLRGLFASGTSTKIVASSNGGILNAATTWFTTTEIVPQGFRSLVPKVGSVVQNTGAPVPASRVVINSVGQASITYLPTLQPGETAIVMNFVTVQGKSKRAKKNCKRLTKTPLPAHAVRCMTEEELAAVVNYPPATPAALRRARRYRPQPATTGGPAPGPAANPAN